ncbi:hypothetical protein K438DRAFT_2017246 [Mycena galopus ATCC 62051]|nr:hypothetical protein K438DRAFT_2017246 [Mycena galopus ATCC 62051]
MYHAVLQQISIIFFMQIPYPNTDHHPNPVRPSLLSEYVSGDLIPPGSKLSSPHVLRPGHIRLAPLTDSLSPLTRPTTSLLPPRTMSQYILFTAPVLAGTQANWALMATLTVQVYKHQTQYPNEPSWIKALVYSIFLLEVAQTGVSSHYAYSLLSLSWGDPTIFVKFLWSTLATPIFSGLTALLVQLFFVWRIYQLKGQNLWARITSGLIVTLAIVQALTIWITDAKFYGTRAVADLHKVKAIVTFWLIDTVVCDTLITITMIFILYQYRQKTPWKRTDTILTRLMANTLENGAVTSTGALLNLILFLAYPENNLNEIPTLILGKLYANVLLFALSMRSGQESQRSTTPCGESLSDSHELRLRRSHLQNHDESRPQTVNITIDVISEAHSDRDTDSKMLQMGSV